MNLWIVWIGVILILIGLWFTLVEAEENIGWLFYGMAIALWWLASINWDRVNSKLHPLMEALNV